jgi:hypothetical protein
LFGVSILSLKLIEVGNDSDKNNDQESLQPLNTVFETSVAF